MTKEIRVYEVAFLLGPDSGHKESVEVSFDKAGVPQEDALLESLEEKFMVSLESFKAIYNCSGRIAQGVALGSGGSGGSGELVVVSVQLNLS